MMKNGKKILMVCAMLIIGILGGCAEKDPGTPPEVLLDGTPVVVGETRPYDLKEQGFTTDDLGKFITKLPDRSWVSSIFLKKDDTSYVSMTLVNDTKEEQMLSLCTIEEVSFYSLDSGNRGEMNISINGVNPLGMTEEELKNAYADLEMDDDDTGMVRFHYLRNGDYTVCFEYLNGVLSEIQVKHSFSKSYETR